MDNIVNSISNLAPALLDVTTLLATPGKTMKVEGKKTGAVAKMPVVIGKTLVQVYVDAMVNLEEPALEIRNVNHSLSLTGCEFLPEENNKNGKLIMSGYIRENVEYTSAKTLEDGSVGLGNSRTSMNIPFKCFTKVALDSEPVFTNNVSPNDSGIVGIAKGRDANDYYYSNSEEGFSFEVAETGIRQVNIRNNVENVYINKFNEEVFSSFTVNMAVDVTLLILQNQYVEIPSSSQSGSGGQNSKSGNSGNENKSNNDKKSDNGGKNKKKDAKASKISNLNFFKLWMKLVR